ncbi:PKD domain-containing protein [Kribbella voronezhensis]|uniref:PKD domain-containing protein n=1 Tax=Kribbella voronezhensis TaxID=2512212 RepID=A0A4R7TBB0_9ACTN|nr:PKD domain-containing protein [Kribbella voronezhensis]
MRGNAKVDGRLGASHPKSTSKHTPAKHVPTVVDAKNLTKPLRRDDLRLNLGICGRVGTDGTVPGPTRCQPFTPDRPDVPPPPGGVVRRLPRPEDVTWEQILAQYRNVLFPKLGVKVQPVGRTLVNLDTIVYTDESKVSVNTVTLLGFPVVVEATPVSYTWHFGDGASVTTTTPGEAYPAKEITHKYMKRGNVKVTLTTNYAARYNVAGTGWQYVDGTVPIVGPATALLVREAVPVLVDPQR